jgi:hypothetical protein
LLVEADLDEAMVELKVLGRANTAGADMMTVTFSLSDIVSLSGGTEQTERASREERTRASE